MERLTPLLPAEAAARIRTLWEEYEACATPEARWVKALDKAETILQHNQGANPADFDYEFNLTYGAECSATMRSCADCAACSTPRRPGTPDADGVFFSEMKSPALFPDGPAPVRR